MANISKELLQHYFDKKTDFVGLGMHGIVKATFKNAKDTDAMWEYDDIGILSGTAGYILVRDGYAIDVVVVIRS